MSTSAWFDDLPVIGKLPLEQAAAKLRELDESEAANALESAVQVVVRGGNVHYIRKSRWPFQDKPWQHTGHSFGYLAPGLPNNELLPIQHAANIAGDPTLKNAQVKITLDRLYIAAYPGKGAHRILFDFYAQNQVQSSVEHLHFNATYRVREGEHAAILGYPLFIGLRVGTEGVSFKCFTVNVGNDSDESLLSFLDSDVFKAGLKLISTVQPAIAPLSGTAVGLTKYRNSQVCCKALPGVRLAESLKTRNIYVIRCTKAIAMRHKNVPVQDFYMGLDFSHIHTRARLAEGSYLAVQLPEDLQVVWDWNEWVFKPTSGQVVNAFDHTQLLPYNYVIFSVSRYDEA